MNAETGELKDVKQGEQPPEGYEVLSPQEAYVMKRTPVEKRPQMFAAIRYCQARKGSFKEKQLMMDAFMAGWELKTIFDNKPKKLIIDPNNPTE